MGVGDVAPYVLPPHLVAQLFHVPDEFLFITTALHAVIHGTDDLHLPTLSLGGGAVLSGAHAVRLLLRVFQNREATHCAELVRKITETLQRAFLLPEHPSGLMADRVDQKVRMDVGLVDVGGDQHLAIRPGFGGELHRQRVRLLGCDVLVRME